MPTFTNGYALAQAQKLRFGVLVRSLRVEHAQLAKDMGEKAVDLTSGRISSKTLKLMGHPFGRGKGRRALKGGGRATNIGGRVSLLPINRQTGRLSNSLRVFKRQTVPQTFILQFMAPHAKFVLSLTGTRRMVPRGFWPAMGAAWRQRNKRLIHDVNLLKLQHRAAAMRRV